MDIILFIHIIQPIFLYDKKYQKTKRSKTFFVVVDYLFKFCLFICEHHEYLHN